MFSEKVKEGFVTTQTDDTQSRLFGGFFKKVAKGVSGLVRNAVPFLGPLIADELDDLIENEIGWDWKVSEYKPTLAEDVILDDWYFKLTTLYKNISTELANALNQPLIANKVTGVNGVMIKLCVIRKHFMTNDIAGLSTEAVQLRSETLEGVLSVLDKLINEANLGGYEKMATVYTIPTINISGYAPSFTQTNLKTIACKRFGVPASGLPFNPEVQTPAPIPTEVENTIPNTLPATSETKNATDQTFLQKNGVWLLLGCVAAWALSGNKKKSKSK